MAARVAPARGSAGAETDPDQLLGRQGRQGRWRVRVVLGHNPDTAGGITTTVGIRVRPDVDVVLRHGVYHGPWELAVLVAGRAFAATGGRRV